MRRAPAHAGSLRGSERLAFMLALALMAAFVVGLTVTASRHGVGGIGTPTTAAGSRAVPAGSGESASARKSGTSAGGHAGQPDGSASAGTFSVSAALSSLLATALQPVARTDGGEISVGVVNESTGTEALYHADRLYHSASIVKADILAALLYQHQVARTAISPADRALATTMIENSNDSAATRLWRAIGRGSGLAAANKALLLRHTVPGSADDWGLTRTTVGDQLQLLADLTSEASPLAPASRDYELGLMANVAPAQRWGVAAAATPGTGEAVKNGWLPDPKLWAINSMGVIQRRGEELLIVVLSKDNPTEAAGIAVARAAALAAAAVMT